MMTIREMWRGIGMLKREMDNEQLVSLANNGDDEAMALLVSRIMPIASAKAAVYNNSRISGEDLVQEGMLGFIEAVRCFSPDKGVPFKAFAEICIGNRIVSAVRENLNNKNAALTKAISLEQDEQDNSAVAHGSDPADILSSNEGVENIRRIIEDELSGFEKSVIQSWLLDKSYSDIAAELDCTEKAVDNALQRVRKKLRSKL